MKTVREVLRELDTERLLETYVYDHPIPYYELQAMDMPASEIFKRYKELYRQFVERLRTMDIQPPEDGHQGILFVSRYLKDYMEENTYELVHADELLESSVKCTSYAYEVTPQAQILGFLVADNPFTQANLYDLMSDVLHEASFFGFQQEAMDEELEKLEEAEARAEAGETITQEEMEQVLHKEFGYTLRRHPREEDPGEARMQRLAFDACRDYQTFCREKELALIKAQLEEKI